MPSVELFIEEVVADFRRRLAPLDNDGDRRAVEDGIALLTDYRLSGMDEAQLQRLIRALRAGRSPVGLGVLKPQTIGEELERRWREFARAHTAVAAGSPGR
ncbi:MAG: hypothetical protein WEC75_10720 [Dehalococcoidia bacterium]